MRTIRYCPGWLTSARNTAYAMAFVLLFSSLLAPVMPVVEAATVSNYSNAEAAALQDGEVEPLNQDDESDLPPNGEGDSQEPPADAPPIVDTDGDGIFDDVDSCPSHPNVGTDWNSDGVDDACDPAPDTDGDMIPDHEDSCPNDPNTGMDWNQDGIDDACDPPPTEDEETNNEDTSEAPVTLNISRWNCPANAQLQEFHAQTSSNACNLSITSPVTYAVSNNTATPPYFAEQPTAATPPSTGDRTTFSGVPAGEIVITQGTLPDFELQLVICDMTPQTGNTVNVGPISIQNGTTWMLTAEPGATYFCYVFNVETGEGNPLASITVTTYWCPNSTTLPDTDPSADPATARTDTDTLKPLCTDPLPEIMGILQYVPNLDQGIGSVFQPPNQHTFTDVPPGSFEMRFLTNDLGEQALYCEGNTTTGNTKPYGRFALASSSTPGFPIDTLNDETIICDWFGMPADMEMDEQEVDDDESLSTLTVTKYRCNPIPQGDYNFATYEQACTDVLEGVSFHLSRDGGEGISDSTRDDGSFTRELPSGSWTMTEEAPGSWLLAVFCLNISPNAGYSPFMPEGKSVVVFIPENADVHCKFYNAAPLFSAYGTLEIQKVTCTSVPPDTANSLWYLSNCSHVADHRFVVRNVDFGNTYDDVTRASEPWSMSEVAPGNLTITEDEMQDYTLYSVGCEPTPDLWTAYPVIDGNSISVFLQPYGHLSCIFANVPSDLVDTEEPPIDEDDDTQTVNVTVTKYQCYEMLPEGESDPYTWYTTNCKDVQKGVTFSIGFQFESPLGSDETDDNGVAIPWDGALKPASYLIDERGLPEGYTPVAAFCRDVSLDGQTGQHMPQEFTSNGILVNIAGEQGLECLWFNYADPNMNQQQEPGSTVQLTKYECAITMPENEMDPYNWYSTNCDQPQNNVTFTLTSPNLNPGQDRTTGPNPAGYTEWTDLPNDQYTLTETMYPGYTPGAVFCSYAEPGMDHSTYSQYQFNQSNGYGISFGIDSTYEIHCKWFNLLMEDEGISLTLYKWKCDPGTMYGQPESYYSSSCDEQHADVPFTVTDANGTTPFESDIDGHQIDGLQGQITLTEMIPPGYGAPVVFCHLLNNGVEKPAEIVTNGSVTLPAADDDYQCFWYNIPLEDFNLTLYKWQCPEGTMYGQMADYYSAECDMEHPNVPFQITDDSGTQDTTSDTNGRQIDNLNGQVTIREMGLPGYGDPVVFCQLLNDQAPTLYTSTNGIVVLPPAMGDDYQCFWYNIPEPASTVTIYKWRCPDGMPTEYSQSWFEMNCKTTAMNDVTFTLANSNGPSDMTTSGGMVQWDNVASGAVQITEHIPPGYSMQPFLVCYVVNPAGMASDPFTPATVNGTWNTTISEPGVTIVCDWYNWYLGDGEITIHKRMCPEGYDRHAWGADPMADCTGVVNGITFQLDQPDPEPNQQSSTGDSIESAVYFGGLPPGDYTISEMVSPGAYQDIFVWQCYGLNSSSVHPTPLSVGQSLNFSIVAADEIVCYWFNVPYPQYGYMVVTKYNCTTEKYVSDVYCYTNQTGQEFNLQRWDGSSWTTIQSGVTDVSGKLTFDNLDAGDYRLTEPNGEACLMKSSNITANKNLGVTIGEETTVYVYNCKTPPPPQKTPTKYPNTGVGAAADSDVSTTPGVAIAGLMGLLGLRVTRRRALAGAGMISAAAASTALARMNAQDLLPLDSTPVPGTPAAGDLWCATPTASTPDALIEPEAGTPVVDPCNRGAIPIHMRIPVIDVDAPIEYLEIIDGQMQQPTGDTHITWYKETSRLGEIGNGIYAAHVNWYGNPEGIFFRLESLQEGDVIEIDGDDQQTLLYEVQWMQNFPSDEEPPEEALGLTDEVAITLITCGGEWSSALSEYDHRTLVRAVLRE